MINISMTSVDILLQHALILLESMNKQHDTDRHSLSSCAMFNVTKHVLIYKYLADYWLWFMFQIMLWQIAHRAHYCVLHITYSWLYCLTKHALDQSLHLHYHWSSFVQACQIVNLHHNSGLLPAHAMQLKDLRYQLCIKYFWWFTLIIEPF